MIASTKIFSLILLFLGVFMLIQIGLPLVSFRLWELSLNTQNLISPKPEEVLGISVQKDAQGFPTIVSSSSKRVGFDQMSLTIPALKIDNATVYVDSNDLSKGLSHLPGSALPGERGNVFISGHSALPQLFNGGKSYGSIFANLSNLKKGDLIKLNIGKSGYSYQVLGFKIVSPDDLSVINPPDSFGRYLTLMTCVPPGLNTKRLVVLGRLVGN